MKMATGLGIGNLEPPVAHRESRTIGAAEADMLFFGGTNRRTIEVIETIEAGLRKPGFTANQVTPQAVPAKLGAAPKPGYGPAFDHRLL